MKCNPIVYAVENDYQIFIITENSTMVWVNVDGEEYYDMSNGIMSSSKNIHSVKLPMESLDKAKEYTVFEQEIFERKTNFPKVGEIKKTVFTFSPLPCDGPIRAYHLADTHNRINEPIAAANVFGEIDMLILNGDIADNSSFEENFVKIHFLAGEISKGKIPVVFARGNHDMRGACADKFSDNTPTNNGLSYYTVKFKRLWLLILDCGEDKVDAHAEYSNTIRCHYFRRMEDKFLKEVADKGEYLNPDYIKRLVVCHIPFTNRHKNEEWAIEKELYSEWGKLLKEKIKPSLMICGHLHRKSINPIGSEFDMLNQPSTLVVGSEVTAEKYEGAGFVFYDDKTEVQFTDNLGNKSEITKIC